MKIVAYAPDGKTIASVLEGTATEFFVQGELGNLIEGIAKGQLDEATAKRKANFLMALQETGK